MISLPIPIPENFTPIVKAGDVVSVSSPIAEKKAKDEVIINLSEMLGVKSKNAGKYLLKNPGDEVRKEEVLAIVKGFWGQKTLRSRVHGTITRYERDTSNLAVRLSGFSANEKMLSPVDGVIDLCDNEKITIQTSKHAALGTKGIGMSAKGDVYFFREKDAYALTSEASGKIIVGKSFDSEIILKGSALDALGMIATDIKDDALKFLRSRNLNMPVLEVDIDVLLQLEKWNDKKIFMDGSLKSIVFLQI